MAAGSETDLVDDLRRYSLDPILLRYRDSNPESSMLMEEIVSLEMERKELRESLTPRISCWVDEASATVTSYFQKKMDSEESFSILHDFEDLGRRMLSLSHFLSISHASIPLYKADELISTTSKSMKILDDLYKSTLQAEVRIEEFRIREKELKKNVMRSNEFLRLSSKVMARPYLYKNELAMLFTKEEEEEYERVREAEREAAERERQREMEWQRLSRKQRKQRRNQQKSVEDEQADEQETRSPTEEIKESMNFELLFFDDQRHVWEHSNGSKTGGCGGFEDKTTLSPMQFTHCTPTPGITPPRAAVTGSTLQVYSFKIAELKDNLKWPLNVYGVVAARDTVDHNRNLLFSRSRIMCQVLTPNDCSLCLTGPSRAILAMDPVDFEVELMLCDGDDELKDRELFCLRNRYDPADNCEQQSLSFNSFLCRAELGIETIPRAVQATILSVRVVGGGSPFKSGGQVACSSSTSGCVAATSEKVVLLDSVENFPEDGLDGYLPLSRKVVSVESQGGLDVVVKAYGVGGSGTTSDSVYFPVQFCNISRGRCLVSGSDVEVTVAWSRLVRDKMDILIEGYATQV